MRSNLNASDRASSLVDSAACSALTTAYLTPRRPNLAPTNGFHLRCAARSNAAGVPALRTVG
jgi:hypothetical protein